MKNDRNEIFVFGLKHLLCMFPKILIPKLSQHGFSSMLLSLIISSDGNCFSATDESGSIGEMIRPIRSLHK